MSDDSKKKKRSKTVATNLELKQTKEETMIAKFLRGKLPHKEGKLAQMVVNIFDGTEAVNILLESKWAKCSDKQSLLFPNRHYAVEYLKTMLLKNFFYRALKVKKKSKKKIDEKVKKKAISVIQTEESKSPKESKKKPIKKDGKIARMKLEVHEQQLFNPDDPDNDDVYVWVYEPFNPWKFLLGGLVLLVILGFCLFPIWPAHLRSVAYYGSIGCMGVLGVLVALIFMRSILFGVIWTVSLGRHHFWLLPNLTADCGVIESFKPLYEYECKKNRTKKLKLKEKEKEVEKEIGNGDVNNCDSDRVDVDTEVVQTNDEEELRKQKTE